MFFNHNVENHQYVSFRIYGNDFRCHYVSDKNGVKIDKKSGTITLNQNTALPCHGIRKLDALSLHFESWPAGGLPWSATRLPDTGHCATGQPHIARADSTG